MKKRTKIASLFLAMLMAFSLMAVTASAYDAGHEHDCAVCSEDEGIMPLGPVKPCLKCGEWVDIIVREVGPSEVLAMPHDNIEIRHVHLILARYESYHCFACGDDMNRSQTILISCYGGQ